MAKPERKLLFKRLGYKVMKVVREKMSDDGKGKTEQKSFIYGYYSRVASLFNITISNYCKIKLLCVRVLLYNFSTTKI